MRFYVFSIGQSVLTSVGLTDLCCAGLGFILGLLISPLLTRTDNFQLPGSFHHVQDPHDPHDQSNLEGVDKLAAELTEKVKVLCWVMTGPTNHQAKVRQGLMFPVFSLLCLQARHVKATWGSRCNKLLFMSSQADPDLPAVKLNVSEGRDNLWDKTKKAFQYVYTNHFQDYDWFVKADDDTYMIVENLRYFLANVDTNKPVFFGRKFKPFTKQGYFSGGAGYVMSKEALRRFVETGLKDPELCRQDAGGAEDVEMGISLSDQQQVTSMFFTGAKSALLFCDQMFFFFTL